MVPCITVGEGAPSVLSPAEPSGGRRGVLRSALLARRLLRLFRLPPSHGPSLPNRRPTFSNQLLSAEKGTHSLARPVYQHQREKEDHLLESAPIFISSHLPALPGPERGSSSSLLRDPYNPSPRPASAGGKSDLSLSCAGHVQI